MLKPKKRYIGYIQCHNNEKPKSTDNSTIIICTDTCSKHSTRVIHPEATNNKAG